MLRKMGDMGLLQTLILLAIVLFCRIAAPGIMHADAEPQIWLQDVQIAGGEKTDELELTLKGANMYGVDTLYLDGKKADVSSVQVHSYEEASMVLDRELLTPGEWYGFTLSKKSGFPFIRLYSDTFWLQKPQEP